MAIHPEGMEHSLYSYSPLRHRPKLIWPGGARLAVCVNLFFEDILHEGPAGFMRDGRWKERFRHDSRLYTWHDYGNRVAIFRIMDVLDRFGLKVTVPANVAACERFPYLVEAFQARGWEISAHGLAVNGVISSKIPEDHERAHIAECIDRVTRAIGEKPAGWFSQEAGETVHTPLLLAEQGMKYVADWANDDQPYVMPGAKGIVSVPNYIEWDDMRTLWDRRFQMPRYPEIVGDAFRQLHQDGAESGRMFSINLHPWLIGAPHRIKYLEQIIETMMRSSGLWLATTRDIVAYVNERN